MHLPLLLLLSSTAHAEDSGKGPGDGGPFPFRVGGATVEPIALAQLWLTAYDMDTNVQADATGYGDPEDDPGMKVKRIRVGLGGDYNRWKYRFVVGTTAPYDGLTEHSSALSVKDAWIGVEPVAGLDIRAGEGKLPYSRDQMMSAADLTFTERGIATEHLLPEDALGLTVSYGRTGAKKASGGKVTLGAYNAGGDLFGDDTTGKTLVGRLEWNAGKADTYSTFTQEKGNGQRKAFGLGIGANAYYTIGVATDTWAAGGDLMIRGAGLSLLVDGTFSHVTPTSTTVDNPDVWAETDRSGVTTQLSYQAGQFEPALRYSMFDDSTLGQYSQILGGVEWHTAENHVAVGAGYEMRLEGQDELDNDTARLWAQFNL